MCVRTTATSNIYLAWLLCECMHDPYVDHVDTSTAALQVFDSPVPIVQSAIIVVVIVVVKLMHQLVLFVVVVVAYCMSSYLSVSIVLDEIGQG